MLDLSRIQQQLPGFSQHQAAAHHRQQERLKRALNALAECSPVWEALREQVNAVRPRWLVAELHEAPGNAYASTPRPTPVTVVATDGSQIYPDRNLEPSCYVLNISRIAFQYGTLEKPLIEAIPQFRYQDEGLLTPPEGSLEEGGRVSVEVVSALRDEYELQALLEVAQETKLPGRPLLAIADGTLIRWMLRGMQQRELEDQLIARYTALLEVFQQQQIPLCSYISMPGNTEVINLLRVHLGEHDPELLDPETSLSGLTDRALFKQVLPVGNRSAVFASSSHIQGAYGSNKICYFYVHVPVAHGLNEIGRVEFPLWIAHDASLVSFLHAVVLSECEKGQGYPMILAEAHERAVIRAQEKAQFYSLIEQEMQTAGLPYTTSRKQASKRRPIL